MRLFLLLILFFITIELIVASPLGALPSPTHKPPQLVTKKPELKKSKTNKKRATLQKKKIMSRVNDDEGVIFDPHFFSLSRKRVKPLKQQQHPPHLLLEDFNDSLAVKHTYFSVSLIPYQYIKYGLYKTYAPSGLTLSAGYRSLFSIGLELGLYGSTIDSAASFHRSAFVEIGCHILPLLYQRLGIGVVSGNNSFINQNMIANKFQIGLELPFGERVIFNFGYRLVFGVKGKKVYEPRVYEDTAVATRFPAPATLPMARGLPLSARSGNFGLMPGYEGTDEDGYALRLSLEPRPTSHQQRATSAAPHNLPAARALPSSRSAPAPSILPVSARKLHLFFNSIEIGIIWRF